jgi:hypothetical protein
MKKMFLLILSAALISAPVFATMPGIATIPARITDAFHTRYATATNVKWSHVIGDYKATFNMGDYTLKAKFDRKGNWMESQKMLGRDRLPMTVKNSLRNSKYSQWKIKSSYEKYSPNEKPEYHVSAAKGDFERKSLKFDQHGQLLNG